MRTRDKIKEKIIYNLDLWMSKGTASMLFMLFAITGAIVVLLGAAIWALTKRTGNTMSHSVWDVLMHTLDPGVVSGDQGSSGFLFVMMLATFAGVFFLALLIGFINDGIQAKMEDLSMGREAVIESGHTVVLGFNESTFIIIEELITANINRWKHRNVVVVMDEEDKKEMEEKIKTRFPSTGNLKVICRSGSIYDYNDLNRCSILTSKSIIIATDNDFKVIKSIMACSQLLNNAEVVTDGYVTAVINNSSNETAAKIAGFDMQYSHDNSATNDRLELLMLENIVSRIMTHTCRQSGLSSVFTELLNFRGSEFYITDELKDPELFSQIKGKSIREINRHLPNAIAIGIVDPDGNTVIDNPNNVKIRKGYGLILLEEEDKKVKYNKATRIKYEEAAVPHENNPVKVLIMECNPKLRMILEEMSYYLCEGSEIYIAADDATVDEIVPSRIIERLGEQGITVTVKKKYKVYDCTKVHDLIDSFNPDFILDLSDYNMCDDDADERTLSILLYIQAYRRMHPEKKIGLTCEMRSMDNQNLVSNTVASDFIISRNIASLMMSQISENRGLKNVIETLLSNEGFEVYMKSPKHYYELGKAMDLYSISDAVAAKGEILIGYRMADERDGVIVNPAKVDEDKNLVKIDLTEDDRLIVVAEDYVVVNE